MHVAKDRRGKATGIAAQAHCLLWGRVTCICRSINMWHSSFGASSWNAASLGFPAAHCTSSRFILLPVRIVEVWPHHGHNGQHTEDQSLRAFVPATCRSDNELSNSLGVLGHAWVYHKSESTFVIATRYSSTEYA